MKRIANIKAPLDFEQNGLDAFVRASLGVSPAQISSVRLVKKSVDARDKRDVHFVLTVDVELAANARVTLPRGAQMTDAPEIHYTIPRTVPAAYPPVVIGLGPAGLFAALTLARAGQHPIVLERGRDVDSRKAAVLRLWQDGILDENNNVQFGEGGAGAFSDGKLNTGIGSPKRFSVLETLAKHGAPEEILYEAKPHIGTDRLPSVVKSIREEIVRLGGQVFFGHTMTELITQGNRVMGVRAYDRDGARTREFETRHVVLAVGHSARDTFEMLAKYPIPMRPKPFSIGARIEHRQAWLDRAQYGAFARHPALGAADYKLSCHARDGRGVYTFCMCPGGSVVLAASEAGHTVTNGMSAYLRDGENANSALLVSVTPEDFPGSDALAGVRFQRTWEEKAFAIGGYRAPAQLVGDFCAGRPSKGPGDVRPSYRPGVTWANLGDCLPEFAVADMRDAIMQFDRRIRGFAAPDAVLTGVETRSSAPLTILRDERYESALAGLFPAGEGAGYAGGILSAAVDGIGCAEAILCNISKS